MRRSPPGMAIPRNLWRAAIYPFVALSRAAMDAREDAGFPRRGSPFDGFGIAGMFRNNQVVQRRPGRVTYVGPRRLCIRGPDGFGNIRERCFKCTSQTRIDERVELGSFVMIKHVGSAAIAIEVES